ncbi:hypothetical protein [Nocardia sp. NPDC059239]|uniref:hypothetical protein n=1 Tax=Nocardia sp. NPDC059239 TaxID=3346785 RepID=UPI0036C3B430
MSDGREQNWYPTSEIGYFTDIVREGISITVGQIELFEPAVGQPYRLDDETVGHAVQVYENQREDQVLFRNQAERWAGEVATTQEKAALAMYVAALDELDRLTDDVLKMCSTLAGQTIEKLLAKSDLKVGLEALGIPRG